MTAPMTDPRVSVVVPCQDSRRFLWAYGGAVVVGVLAAGAGAVLELVGALVTGDAFRSAEEAI